MDEPRLKVRGLTDSFSIWNDTDRFGLDPFPIRRSIYSNGSMTRHPFTILSILRCFEYTAISTIARSIPHAAARDPA